MNKKIAITIGDPSGIGSEIIAKALSDNIDNSFEYIVVGSGKVMLEGIRIANVNLKINTIKSINHAVNTHGIVNVIDVFEDFDIEKLEYGKIQKQSGLLAGKSIETAIALAMAGKVDAVVTAPINKESFKLAGYPYPGHTEMFADFTHTTDYSMILMHGNLRVAHVTTHVSMYDAIQLIKKERVLKIIKVADNACKDLGIKNPVIAVLGLNPHAGENGLFGNQEIDEIIPAIHEAQSIGINAVGPIPGDTAFPKALSGMYDCVVVMYHDQGHIPVKLLGFSLNKETGIWDEVKGVNISFGMPIIRVSVDHGTAFGKAGKGTANPNSLINAIETAIVLIKNKQ
ncbi:MAG: 4-hydroxythreonine-4-phosphate dehydrogenase PdxA [Prevotellaceae bacterium]|jgi:4-hydroxythreonine-4-phosphate dehydrogenase|nr:4-hydroxythreonine-4-phosphate dehydrogenase PdxA [Prevotellaceae bacterium]